MTKRTKDRPTPTLEPVLRSVPDTARLLGVSESSVWGWIRNGLIESRAVGRRRLIPTTAINAILERGLAA
jgi:excisionase family DNA binding protein